MSRARTQPLIIFDCDGVLVDSEPLASLTLAEQLQHHGFPYSTDDCRQLFTGLSLASCQQLIEDHNNRPLPPGFFEQLQHKTFDRFAESLQPVAGVVGVLDFLDATGIAYCVASSGDHQKMHFTLGHTQLLSRFTGKLFSAVDVSRGKPAPDLFLHAAGIMGYTPDNCIVIEDSLPGIEAAIAAGMRACAYGAAAAGSSTVPFSNMSELPDILRTFL